MHDRHDQRLHEDLPILCISVTILCDNDNDDDDDTTDNDQEGEDQ